MLITRSSLCQIRTTDIVDSSMKQFSTWEKRFGFDFQYARRPRKVSTAANN
jgi:hypothetical protein